MATISGDAVKKATGRDWDEWFPLLDRAGAKKLAHRDIVDIVGTKFGVGSWWRQMVTVEYERARGLRVTNQNAMGFTATASKTVASPVERVYRAWINARTRQRWLNDPAVEIRSARPNKSLRIGWKDGTSVVVGFIDKSAGKSQVAVSHDRLKSAAAVARMKSYWKQQLSSLQDVVES
ncbi:MAG TPA: hypothetical protein VGM67_20395 [Gemmatimonadaceae bacterium]|jgi:uncharacterized protein YndB with AHSA1/START domain